MIKFIFSIKPWLRITIGLLYLVLIVLLSLLPTSDLPDIPLFSGEDKWIHSCMYLGLGFIACWSLDFSEKARKPHLFLLLTGVFMWGVLMEVLQRLMSNGRGMEILDMVANMVGAVAGLILYKLLAKKQSSMAEAIKG
ncbi:MAG: VanZ family protein [Lentimicrobiaceae bacterium]|jgi:VanZ family protein